jgi:hypothetical protein
VTSALGSAAVVFDCDTASCEVDCNTVSACSMACRNQAECRLGCDTVAACVMDVDAESRGWLSCSVTVAACQILCDNPTDCGGGVIACNRACP